MATVVKRLGDEVRVAVPVRLSGSLLEMEGAIQEAAPEERSIPSRTTADRLLTGGSPRRILGCSRLDFLLLW